ncbi:hypothetical protein GW17_00023919 [Ensete ventricosum]|nr:hypothetical protein GW17_00023919 [Ensete ventricosum]
MWIARYRAVPPKVDRRRPIEGEKGKKKKRKRKKRREEENLAPVLARAPMSPLPCTGIALAHGSPARRHPRFAGVSSPADRPRPSPPAPVRGDGTSPRGGRKIEAMGGLSAVKRMPELQIEEKYGPNA